MNVNVDEFGLFVTILEVAGEVPNDDEFDESEAMTLGDATDLLYKDGDYFYDYEDTSDIYPEITVHVFAYTNPDPNSEEEEVGTLRLRLGADCVSDAIRYMEKA